MKLTKADISTIRLALDDAIQNVDSVIDCHTNGNNGRKIKGYEDVVSRAEKRLKAYSQLVIKLDAPTTRAGEKK